MKEYLFIIFFLCSLFGIAQPKWSAHSAQTVQTALDKEYANKKESPLTEVDFRTFKGLDFYPINSKYAVEAQFIKAGKQKAFKMKTSGTRTPEYIKYGELLFKIDGKPYRLYVYQSLELIKKEGFADYLFLPFFDLTCGKESYVGGRYIDLRIPKTDKIILDFNTAYNPYCAYNHNYSCPIVPMENDLPVAIMAGVKKFHQ